MTFVLYDNDIDKGNRTGRWGYSTLRIQTKKKDHSLDFHSRFNRFFRGGNRILWKPLIDTVQKPEQFRVWINYNGTWGRLAFIGMVALQVIFAVIPGEPVELGAGYAFGTFEGTALYLTGDAVGTSVIFLFTKLLGIRLVEALVGRKKLRSIRFLKNNRNLNLLIFILFFIPGTPKDVITYVIGLTPIKLTTFLILTSIARIPSILTSTITGNALGVQDYKTAIIVYAVTGAVSLAGLLLYRRISACIQKRKSKRSRSIPTGIHHNIGEHSEKDS